MISCYCGFILLNDVSHQQSYVVVALHVIQTNELHQLAAVAFCLLFAWVSFYYW
jgi:hypothetical protein